MNETTKKQFDELKAKNPDAVLLFRVGDFYETYEDDAVTVSDVLGITLTKRGGTRMAGFPHHALDTYLPKLVRAGQRVAICDQLSETPAQEPKTSQTLKPTNMERKIQEISLNEIRPSAMNPRKTFDQESLQELADNIKRQGLLQPITIRPVDELLNTDGTLCHYEVVCGERRYRAVKMNGSKTISCIVREMTDEDAFDAMITENLQRKDVDPMEESFAFAQLVKNGKTIEEIALRFGKSKRFIADRIRLDKLLPELKKAVTDEKINIGSALLLCKLDENQQQEFLDEYNLDDLDEGETIVKDEVEDFIDNMFMRIDRAPWKEDFCGSCGCACEKCQFNNANAGCLFYEMKITKEQASCTNRDKFNAKRMDWLKHLIDENDDVLVKKDCELETGKTIICTSNNSGGDSSDYDEMLKHCDEKGYRHVPVHTMFNRWSSYSEGDPRLQEKLSKNEVYRVLVIEKTWNGVSVFTKFLEVIKREAETDEKKAMELVRQYKENISRHGRTVAGQFRKAVAEYDVNSIDSDMLTDNEYKILCIVLLKHLSYDKRKAIMGESDEIQYMERNNTSEVQDMIIREYLKHELSDSGVEYWDQLQKAQAMLVDEWGIDAVDVRAKAAEKLAKKQEPIEKELLALGYNAEGKKLDF